MSGTVETLREIHRLRKNAAELQAQIERLPRQLKAQQAKVARQEELLREAQDAIKKVKVAIHEKEVTLKTTHQQIAKHQKQLNEAAGKKEYDALRLEIQLDKEKVGRLEDEILGHMTDVEERTAKLPELEKSLKQAKDEAAEFERNLQARQANLSEQLRQATESLQTVEQSLPADVRAQYDRLVTARAEDALSAVQGRNCVACYTGITAQNYNDLLAGRLVFCKSCGRILYLPTQAPASAEAGS